MNWEQDTVPEELEGDIGETVNGAIRLLVRRRWLITGTAFMIAVATIAVSLHLRNRMPRITSPTWHLQRT